MDFTLMSPGEIPMGMEKETAQLAKELRHRYHDFFTWMQKIEEQPDQENLSRYRLEELMEGFRNSAESVESLESTEAKEEAGAELWYLSKWDVEYFYALARPAEVGCSCPFGWMEKVERLIDQQYPIFGVERFPDLYEKAAHMAWLLMRNEIFPTYNSGIAVLAALVLLARNEKTLTLDNDDLKAFVTTAKAMVPEEAEVTNGEERAVRILANLLRK